MSRAVMTAMPDPSIHARLRDPAYFSLHLQAAMAIREVSRFKWYDSHFLRRFEIAKLYLEKVRPDAVGEFVEGFAPIRPDPSFSVTRMDEVFDPPTRQRIIETSRAAVPTDHDSQSFENSNFGRDVVWDEPFFCELQEHIRPQIEQLTGRKLETSYNFLSRYSGAGVCAPHMDHPDSMFTFDYCIEQSEEWPIHFSKVVDWPTRETVAQLDLAAIKQAPELDFAAHCLRPNQALLFNGSSQWHYRDPITPGGFCNLLFFHYIPAGCGALVEPRRWAEHFAIPELGPLCDLFARNDVDGFA